jgi:4'-phosphopantetheinyl transferase
MSCWSLAGQDVHIWYAQLDQLAGRPSDLAQVLSPDEQARADRFQFERDRGHFIVARAILRMLLGGYLAAEPSRLVFAYDKYGKPALADGWRDAGIEFNLAHSHGLAVYAFTRHRAIGVDVEYVRALENVHQIAAHVFSQGELAAFHALPAGLQPAAFFNGWTRKEAFVKATGQGLAAPLEQISVTLAPGEPAALLRLGGCPAAAAPWTIRELAIAPGYAAAVALPGAVSRLVCRQWRNAEMRS